MFSVHPQQRPTACRDGSMTADERAARTRVADELCVTAYDEHDGPGTGAALVAVGGYGRGELAPHSDLDVVLVHDDTVDPGVLAEQVWYPIWDSGAQLDHSVRSVSEMVAAATADLKVALGLQDIRYLAGDRNLVLRVRTTMLAQWRRQAGERLPALAELVRSRHELMGELAHVAVPDLKEAQGGLRDATVLKALVATWLVDVPHVELEACRQQLLDVRDNVQGLAGRAQDRITPEIWPGLAEDLGLPEGLSAQVHVRELARRIAHISRLTWRRVDAILARPAVQGQRRPLLETIAAGIALSSGE
ncbi:MAG: nucleotidyltransferase domain-containing protein, partial [Nocardioides sp.]|nr:nucleotidyltransferase domain-containing protein [Nocardioides sp.]